MIRDQLVNNMIAKVSENQSENPKEFFPSDRPVIRQNAGSTKLRAVMMLRPNQSLGILLRIV